MLTTRRPFRTVFLALSLAAGSGCSDSTDPTGLANGSMTARIDGQGWEATVAIAATFSNGIVAIAGTDGQGTTLGFGAAAPGPGTFAVGPSQPANGSITAAGKGWQAAITNGSGSISFTRLDATGAVGTFQFTMAPLPSTGATGNRAVTQGAFDVKF